MTMTAIKAIETRYKGYRFRSRLEARWAVFFDALGIGWKYEHEGYNLQSGLYLPDFYLPVHGVFVEIKGTPACEDEVQKCRDLRDVSDCAVLLAVGLPYENPITLFGWDMTDGSAGSYETEATWLFHSQKPRAIIHGDSRIDRDRDIFAAPFYNRIVATSGIILNCRFKGWDAARAARFEHGETP